MLQIRAYVPPDHVDAIVARLDTVDGITHVMRVGTTERGAVLVTADVSADAADVAFEILRNRLPTDSVSLVRLDGVDSESSGHSPWLARDPSGLAWTEVVAEARASSRLLSRYLALMAVAGVVAAVGVTEPNTILIVGAMAISPDLLPLAAACVGITARRPRLVTRSVGTLSVGLLTATVAAAITSRILEAVGVYSGSLGSGGLEGLTSTDPSTLVIALAAGVAAMLTYESRAGAAVGVAISVTTIPASAYLGVAAASSQGTDALGAVGVLATNLGCLLVSGTLTLAAQRWFRAWRSGWHRPL